MRVVTVLRRSHARSSRSTEPKENGMGFFAQDKQERAARRLYRKDPEARKELAELKETADARVERFRQQYLADERDIVSRHRHKK